MELYYRSSMDVGVSIRFLCHYASTIYRGHGRISFFITAQTHGYSHCYWAPFWDCTGVNKKLYPLGTMKGNVISSVLLLVGIIVTVLGYIYLDGQSPSLYTYGMVAFTCLFGFMVWLVERPNTPLGNWLMCHSLHGLVNIVMDYFYGNIQ